MTARCTSRATTSSQYLEKTFPTPKLIPAGYENEVAALLKHEDDLHLDLRTLSFRFVFAPPGPPKPAEALKSYAANGSGTVQGVKDRDKEIQIEFWERAAREGFTDESGPRLGAEIPHRIRGARQALAQHPYLMGDNLSVLDIAWFIYAHRLSLAGYPFARLHPRVDAFVKKLHAKPEFGNEVANPPEFDARLAATRKAETEAGKTLEIVAGL